MLLPIDGYSVGEHPIIARLLKVIFHVRLPEPRHSFTWDVLTLKCFVNFLRVVVSSFGLRT